MYTKTDEAPFLATKSFLPIVKAFTRQANIDLKLKDISLAARILANMKDYLDKDQQVEDALAELGAIAQQADANIIKLPNISASVPQLKAAIQELQAKGYKIPDYPENPSNEEQEKIKQIYAKVLGSAVNPVLREGNSDRRVARAVKEYAKKNPHSMGEWTEDSKSHVASMQAGDFYGSEKSYTADKDVVVSIELHGASGKRALKEGLKVESGEVIDVSCMSVSALREYYRQEMQDTKKQDLLLSLHLKATMMKVSDPILFGHAIEIYFADIFDKYHSVFLEHGIQAKFGLADIFAKLEKLENGKQIKEDFLRQLSDGPSVSMVNSDKGITNFHVPSDVIIDASMPAAIRNSGKMWGADGKAYDTKALIPDRCYAGVYQATMDFCKKNGAFDPTTMGTVSNVGLMAKKAEEYGSHDKTFEIVEDGSVKVIAENGEEIFSSEVKKGDIWRMCQTKDIAIKDWVRLGVERARNTGNSAIFWLDEKRSHDSHLIAKVESYLSELDTSNLEIKIMNPVAATNYTCQRLKEGKDTISITGNVLRDYLTDLFPILELGTSAKMLSIVPLLAGGGLFETGAGGSAPKHVQQLLEENHLRWDSLGEFLALAVSLEAVAEKTKNAKAKVLAEALDIANERYLTENKSPSRKVKELDTRGSHFYLSMFWAQALSEQNQDSELKECFTEIFERLEAKQNIILEELNNVQGASLNLGGYYYPEEALVEKAMRASPTLNAIIDSI
tara:strand:+ start:26851 stop:29046 length:2196 start_codon:yes stop_codon:yes gene_type:complete